MSDSTDDRLSYTPTDKSRVRRLPKRGQYDHATVHAILDAALLGHVGYTIDGSPYVTPTVVWREGERLYWHGSSASRMLRTQRQGIPVCVTVTHFDGLVLARSGFHHSVNYRSVMAFGHAAMVDDPQERHSALDAFVERLYPGRTEEIRPISAKELKATSLIGMVIEEASAKIRTGPPVDDEPDYALDCWAGVIPLALTIGAPIPDERLKPGIPPLKTLRTYAAGRTLPEVLASLPAPERKY